MSITARSRKRLWARSGNRCAMCRRELVREGSPPDGDSIVGDECHIVSATRGGPRYDPEFPREKADDNSNLVLLCKVDHKVVDDQESKYTANLLRDLKAAHERRIAVQLEGFDSDKQPVRIRQVAENVPNFLRRIRSGKELLAIMSNACAYALDYDELRNEEEVDLVSGFLQDAQDWGELGLDEVGSRMRAAQSLDEHINGLEQSGFWVFGCRENQLIEGGDGPASGWPVAHLRVMRDSNPEIIKMNENGAGPSKKDAPQGDAPDGASRRM